jgi:linoleoyl-CoA desaturase
MGGSIYVLAGNVHNWQVQHNVLHHTYTNSGHDEDLDAGRVIRFRRKCTNRQPNTIISVFLYGLLTLGY